MIHDIKLPHPTYTVGDVDLWDRESVLEIVEASFSAFEQLVAENERFRGALEIIAGKRQAADNLMSDQDVAMAALAQGANDADG